jgi:hypothetical protein
MIYSDPTMPSTPSTPVTHTSAQLIVQSAPHLGGCLYSTHSRGGSRKVVGVMAAAKQGKARHDHVHTKTSQRKRIVFTAPVVGVYFLFSNAMAGPLTRSDEAHVMHTYKASCRVLTNLDFATPESA